MKCPKCHSEISADTRFCSNCAAPLHPADEISVSPTKTLETPTKELTRGSTFAKRYEVIEELGKGGMGKVYRVFDKKIEEEVALKLLNPEIAADKKTIDRFRNELKYARKISQRNVCRMYDLGEEEGTHYITMEYVGGEDLKSTIRRVGPLGVGKAIFIAKQVCEGLAEAHRLRVVHRDLKPQNIMIDKEGNALIMDFGIARSLKAKGITGSGVMIGTPEYMSPEQAEVKEVDHRSDIYSLGVILYEMVTGQVPFEGETPLSIAMKHKSAAPKNPKQLNAQIPEDLSLVILRCMEKDKEKRYQRVEEILSGLSDIEKGIPTTERVIPERKPITSREITVKFNLRKIFIPAVVLLAVIVVVLMLFRSRGLDVDPNRVVVAVFENQTGDPELDPLGRMAADWITQGLAQTGLVSVVPVRPAAMDSANLKGEDRIRLLAKETSAGKVVSGAYYLQGETIRFHAKVTDVQEGKILSALDPVSGPVEDPIKPIESLRQRVMGALASVFDPRLKPFVDIGSQPPTYEAYQEYIEGGKLFTRREYRKALEYFTRATNLDSTFKLPMLHAAVAHLNLGEYAEANALGEEVEKSRKKLSLHDRNSLDYLQAVLSGDNGGQLRVARQGTLIAPGIWVYLVGLNANRNNRPQETIDAYATLDPEKGLMKTWYFYWYVLTKAHHTLGNYKQELKEARRGRKQYADFLSTIWYEVRALAALGRIKEVNKLVNESLTLPPQRGWNPGLVMLYAGRELRAHGYQEASLQVLARAIKWFESSPQEEKATESQRSGLARALYTAEKWEEAQPLFEVLHQEFPDNVNYLGYLGRIAARRGDREEALRISSLLQNIKRPYLFGSHTFSRALIASLLEEKERAVRLLRDALAQGLNYTSLHPAMDLESLRDYPPFKELIKPKG